MRLALRLSGRGTLRGLLYSFRELELSLRVAGFASREPLWAVPDARYPKTYLPPEATAVRTAHRSAEPRTSSRAERTNKRPFLRDFAGPITAWAHSVRSGLYSGTSAG